ncbi:MAG: 5-formyltetrahydrofolate cyclo-ligase [Pseudomonadota bacterium]
MHSSTSRKELRQTIRQRRRGLDGFERTWRETSIIASLRQHPAFRRARRIACYWPADGEADMRLLSVLTSSRQSLYLPILTRGSRLRFAQWQPHSPMRLNRFRIPEPRHRTIDLLFARELDLVLMPLVGFDDDGNRLGMGGGFYDRTLAFRHARRRWRKPLLIGVAFELQRCPPLPAEPWDVPLDGIVTEDGVRLFDRI